MKSMHTTKGYSIISTLIAIAIFGLILSAITVFQVNIFSNKKIIETRSELDQRSILILRAFSKEVRAAQSSHTGSYPLVTVGDSEFTFYSDTTADGIIERVRYFVSSNALKKGVVVPTGSPLTYVLANERVNTLVSNVQEAGPYFFYYNESFNGVTSTTPLAQPVPIQDVRVVRMNMQIKPPNANVAAQSLDVNAMIRNLKSNQ